MPTKPHDEDVYFQGEGSPLVTVLLPVYNGEPFLRLAVDSVVRQTYKNLEIILINDGSTDTSQETLTSFAARDSRIILLNRENRGIVESLNEGLALAKGKYVARMDADDISMPRRLARQVAYLEKHPDVVLLGVRQYEDHLSRWLHSKVRGVRNCTWALLFLNYIGHPGVMFRMDTLRKHGLSYRSEYQYVEDYKLWCEITCHGWADVLNEPLLFYRRHDLAASKTSSGLQAQRDRRVSIEQLFNRLNVDMSDLETASVRNWVCGLNSRMFKSEVFNGLSDEDRAAIHVMFQEYSLRNGLSAPEYLKQVGMRPAFLGPWWGMRYLYRSIKYSIRKV